MLLFVVVAALASSALPLHDTHLDLTRDRAFTPAAPALAVVEGLRQPVRLTYFFQAQDPQGRRARDVVTALGRRTTMLEVRTVDPDREPELARKSDIGFYNAALLETADRRVLVRSTDEIDIAIGIQRLLRERVIEICFIEGHGEYPSDNFEYHTHLEGLSDHQHGQAGAAVIHTTGHGIGRLRRALVALGYEVRVIMPAQTGAIPADCAVTVDAGPRTTYLPNESAALRAYLARGGAALLMYDLGFTLEPGLERLLATLGVRLPQAAIVEPQNHYGTDPEMVAVSVYETHPITHDIAFTFFPGARVLELGPAAKAIRVSPLIESSDDSRTRAVAAVEQRSVTGASPPAVRAATPRRYPLAAAIDGRLAGGEAFRAVVVGDGDFASNSFFPYVANSDLALAMLRWLAREEHVTPVASRIPVAPVMVLSKTQMRAIFVVVEVALPLAVVALGALVWWRRR